MSKRKKTHTRARMRFDILRFCSDYGVPTASQGESRHVRGGWVQVPCPKCDGGSGWHLGHNEASNYWNCWRCGRLNALEVVESLAGVRRAEAMGLLQQYETTEAIETKHRQNVSDMLDQARGKRLTVPGDTKPRAAHIRYLESRRFDWEELVALWGVRFVSNAPAAYRWRVAAPIEYGGRVVSYQARDITDTAQAPWKACASEDEILPHQMLVYGADQAHGEAVVVVEGLGDAWRLGPGAVSVFGTGWTEEQAAFIRSRWRRVFILFDNERPAQQKAKALGRAVSSSGIDVEIIDLPGTPDPGKLTKKEARKVMRTLVG